MITHQWMAHQQAAAHGSDFDSDAIGMNAFLDGAIVLVAMVAWWAIIPNPPSWGYMGMRILIGFCS